MHKKIVVFIIITTFCQFIYFSFAGNGQELGIGEAYVRNRLLVKIKTNTPAGIPGESTDRISNIHRLQSVLSYKFGTGTRMPQWKRSGNYYILETIEDCDIEELCERLRGESFVADASPDYYAYTASMPPNDPYFRYQYALHNTGQVYEPGENLSGTGGDDIKALDGWDWTTGSEDVVIAILDSGVAWDHEDLKNKVVPGYNFVFQNDDPYDDAGHGTFVASVAAAETNNGIGIAGVSWRSKIMPVKVVAGFAIYSIIADGIRYAADQGARVINMSLGGTNPSFVLEDACKYAFGKGAVLVASTGNYGWDRVLYPAAYDEYCLAVGASDANDERWENSNFGPAVDVVAPGVNVIGALFDNKDPNNLNSYEWGSGTSYAAPCVSGVAALLIAYKPYLTNTQVMDLIRFTADDINSSTNPGIDDFIGYGRVNLKRLLGPYILQ